MTSSATYKDIQLKIKEEFNMKRLPRQLNVFFFFLSSYKLHKQNTEVREKYFTSQVIESNYHENFFSSDLSLSFISKGKLQSMGLRTKDYNHWFDRFTQKFSDKTFNRCERFQWKSEADNFFEQFLDLDIIEFEQFKREMNK